MSSPLSPARLWTSRVLSALPALMLIGSSIMKISHNPEFLKSWAEFGYADSAATPIGIAELTSAILYLIPRTSVLGVVLITGYMGGAIATHVHAGQNFLPPLMVALVAWGGLYLREERLWALLPLRRD